MKGEQKFLAVC